MLSVEEYKRIKELADMAERIRERKTTPKESYIPFNDVMAKAGISL